MDGLMGHYMAGAKTKFIAAHTTSSIFYVFFFVLKKKKTKFWLRPYPFQPLHKSSE